MAYNLIVTDEEELDPLLELTEGQSFFLYTFTQHYIVYGILFYLYI